MLSPTRGSNVQFPTSSTTEGTRVREVRPVLIPRPDAITEISVIVATKGRPRETAVLLGRLRRQTIQPNRVLVVGAGAEDIAFRQDAPDWAFDVQAWVAARAGLTIQRNEGVRWLRERGLLDASGIVIFFDDDFRPADDWIAQCARLFETVENVAGMTGQVLADGIGREPLSETEAAAYLEGVIAPQPHWTNGERRDTTSVYGCNMAFAGPVLATCLFDESLPLYGWQEDRDMTGQARKLGRVIFAPECLGVHMGARGARTSGVPLGYSQIANMVHLARKGTVERSIALRFLSRSLIANIVRSVYRQSDVDHVGRLKGNLLALGDLARGRCRPGNILNLR